MNKEQLLKLIDDWYEDHISEFEPGDGSCDGDCVTTRKIFTEQIKRWIKEKVEGEN